MKLLGVIILAIIAGLALAALSAWFVMLLWNYVVATTFGLPTLTFWKAFGLMVLLNLLFSGMRAGNSSRSKD